MPGDPDETADYEAVGQPPPDAAEEAEEATRVELPPPAPAPGLTRSQAGGALAAMAVLLVAGILIEPWLALLTIPVAGTVALVFPQGLQLLLRRRYDLASAAGLVYGAAALVFFAATVLLYPAWQTGLVRYCDNLVSGGTRLLGKTGLATTAPGQPAPALAPATAAAQTGWGTRVEAATRLPLGQRFLVFVQVACFGAVFLLLPLVLDTSLLGRTGEYLGRGWHQYCRTGVARLSRALMIGVLATVALWLAAFESSLFLGGTALIVSLFCGLGTTAAILLALFLLPVVASLKWSGLGLIVTAVLLWAAENRPHWYLLPWFQPEQLPPGFLPVPRQEASRVNYARLILVLQSVLSFAIFGAVCLVIYGVWHLGKIDEVRKQAQREATALLEGSKYGEAAEVCRKLLDRYPGDRPALLELTRALARQERYTDALQSAEQVATWAPGAVPQHSFMDNLAVKLRGLMDVNQYDPAEAYRAILDVCKEQPEKDPVVLNQVAEKLSAHDPKSIPGFHARALAAYATKDFAGTIAEAEKALAIRPDYPDLNLLIAHAYYDQKKFNEAINYCKQELEYDSENKEARTLRAWAQSELDRGKPGAAPTGVPAPGALPTPPGAPAPAFPKEMQP